MAHDNYRIVFSVMSVLVAPGAMVWALHGLIFDDVLAFRCGVAIVMASIIVVVALLNSQSNGGS